MSENLVIIPTYNEKENIQAIVLAVLSLPQDFHVLVVDDSSPDQTAQLVKNLQEKHSRLFLEIRQEKDGLGKAYVHGFKWATKNKYNYIFEMDADFSHNPNDLPKLLYELKSNADVVIGSRYLTGVNVVNWPMGRVLLSYIASKYVRLVTSLPVKDATSGFVGYKKEVLLALNLSNIRFKGYGFQVEMKYKSWIKKFKLKEVSIIFTDRTAGQSKMSKNIISEAIFGILMLRIRNILGKL